MPLLLEPDKLESIDRVLKAIKSIDGPLKPLKTTQQIWRKAHSFEGYARDMPEMALFLLRFLSWVHAGHCWVPNKNKSGKMTPMVMHPGQIIVLNAMIEQAFEVKPIRLIIPKSRRQGVSTIVTAVFRFLCDHIPDRNARLSAHTEPSAKEIFDIVRRSHAKVLTDRANGKPHKYTDLAATEIKFERTGSVFSCMTAMGRHGGSGGKTDYLEISELAKMDKTSQQDLKALDSLLPTVTDGDPGTIVVIESTGQGTVGEFYKRTMAVLEGKRDDDGDDTEDAYKCVFLPWTIDSMCREPRGAPKDFDGFKRPLSGYEIMLRDDFKCDPAQIYWRRKKLRERGCKEYGENPFSFAREFPLTVNECFLSATGRVYPMMVREPPYMQELPPSFFSQFATHYRAIDWGHSESSPFVCLWFVIDPTKPAGFVVDPGCNNFWTELENYSYDEKTGDPIKAWDHGCDCARYLITSIRPRGLVYARKELYVRDFGGRNDPQTLARKVHIESDYFHPSGDPDHPDVSKYTKSSKAYTYQTGVADRARNDLISQFKKWGIPLVGYRNPHQKDSGKGIIHDGIAMMQALMAGGVIFDPEPEEAEDEKLFRSAIKKLSHPRGFLPTDEEMRVLEERIEQQEMMAGSSRPRDFDVSEMTGWNANW